MNRAELIDAMAKQSGFTKADCDRWLSAFTSTVEKNIRKKGGIKIVGFGTFTTGKRKARNGRNPQTGKTIKIAARTVPVFRAGSQLKEMIRKAK